MLPQESCLSECPKPAFLTRTFCLLPAASSATVMPCILQSVNCCLGDLGQRTQPSPLFTLRFCQDDMVKWQPVTFRPWDWQLKINPQVPRDPQSIPVGKECAKSWRRRSSNPLLNPASASTLAEGHRLRNTASWHFSGVHCLIVFSKSLMR